MDMDKRYLSVIKSLRTKFAACWCRRIVILQQR